jgi:hypothetical protein
MAQAEGLQNLAPRTSRRGGWHCREKIGGHSGYIFIYEKYIYFLI